MVLKVEDPRVDSCSGQVECHVYRVIHIPAGSVSKLQTSLIVSVMVFKVKLHHHTGQGNRSVVVKSCGLWFFGDSDNGGGLEAGLNMECLQ